MEMNSVMHNDLKEVLLTEEDIQNICKELGAQLTKDYQGKPLCITLFISIFTNYNPLFYCLLLI